jgi:2-oxoglutarate ferredoxin oxidoreductase subunit alpha
MQAFNWADKYQLPVIVLVDKYLAECQMTVNPFDTERIGIDRGDLTITDRYSGKDEYARHRITNTGVSPRLIPSTKGAIVRTNSDEHDEYGHTSERADNYIKMQEKRLRKLEFMEKELEEKNIETTRLFGSEEAGATIIAWGSTKGPIREAMKLLKQDSIDINYLQVVYLQPFPTKKIEDVLNTAKKTIVVEQNQTSQLSGLIRQNILKDVDNKILKYDGRPWNPGDLAQKIKEVL